MKALEAACTVLYSCIVYITSQQVLGQTGYITGFLDFVENSVPET
jgi:hypothetical protein